MASRDIYVRTDGERFELELRQGGSEGRSARPVFDSLDDALREAAAHMPDVDDWRDVSDAHQR